MSWRIARAIVGVVAVAIVLFGVPLAYAIDNLYQSRESIRLEAEATEAALSATNLPTADTTIQLPTAKSSSRFASYDLKGNKTGGNGPIIADPVTMRALSGDVTNVTIGDNIISVVPVQRDHVVIGAIRGLTSESVVHHKVYSALLLMLAAGVVVIAVAGYIGVLVARRLTKPIAALATTATALGDGQFEVATTLTGITEIDDVSGALTTTAHRLSDHLERERSFSQNASHQLRTPVTALRVTLEASQGHTLAANDTISKSLALVDRIQTTIDDLLILTREPLDIEHTASLDDMISDASQRWAGQFATTQRSFVATNEAPAVELLVQSRAVRQALDVLIDNALHHGAGDVTLSTVHSSGGVMINVSDQGSSAITNSSAIFTRGVGSGTGIGLALARSLVEGQGGRLILRHAGPNPMFSIVFGADRAHVDSSSKR